MAYVIDKTIKWEEKDGRYGIWIYAKHDASEESGWIWSRDLELPEQIYETDYPEIADRLVKYELLKYPDSWPAGEKPGKLKRSFCVSKNTQLFNYPGYGYISKKLQKDERIVLLYKYYGISSEIWYYYKDKNGLE